MAQKHPKITKKACHDGGFTLYTFIQRNWIFYMSFVYYTKVHYQIDCRNTRKQTPAARCINIVTRSKLTIWLMAKINLEYRWILPWNMISIAYHRVYEGAGKIQWLKISKKKCKPMISVFKTALSYFWKFMGIFFQGRFSAFLGSVN